MGHRYAPPSYSLLSSVTELDITRDASFSDLDDLMDYLRGLFPFNPFAAVSTLHLSGKAQLFIVSSLLGDAVEEKAIAQFITARQNSGHPVILHCL